MPSSVLGSFYSSPFSSNPSLELREQELIVEAVDWRDVGEDPCNDVLRDSSLCELSAKYLQRKCRRKWCKRIKLSCSPSRQRQKKHTPSVLLCSKAMSSDFALLTPKTTHLTDWIQENDVCKRNHFGLHLLTVYCFYTSNF